MNFNIDNWMKTYLSKLQIIFNSNLLFAGLQGSYSRGEATEASDIDAVVILKTVTAAEIKKYAEMLDSLSNREKICGFISGKEELMNWERSDLFQFYHDTMPYFGNIDFLLPLISKNDVQRAVRIGACNIYHMCGHNMIHEKDYKILKTLYKSAVFTIQADHFYKTGKYLKQKNELISELNSSELKIIQTGIIIKKEIKISQPDFESYSELLFNWAANLINEYRIK
ncbi:MAG: nucleotidyltransferase domain-containing protein [Candidatus Wallbacteria bacterium]